MQHWHYFPTRSFALSISLYFVFRCGLIKTASSLPLDTALFASSDHKAPYLRKMPASLGSHQMHPLTCCQLQGRLLTETLCAEMKCLREPKLTVSNPSHRARVPFSGSEENRHALPATLTSDGCGDRSQNKCIFFFVFRGSPPQSLSGKDVVHLLLLRCTHPPPNHASLLN